MKSGKRILATFLVVLLFTMVATTMSISSKASSDYDNTHINTGNQRLDIVEVAKTQVGYEEGSNNDNKYGLYFGHNNVSWCAYFVVWCARQAGIDSSIVKLTGWATADDLGAEYHGRDAARTERISYIPEPGDFIIYDWADGGYCYKSPASFYGDHVGIVEYVENGYVHTIEGNNNDAVRRRVIALDDDEIKGYGVPAYSVTEAPDYVPGDINGDGDVNNKDLTRLMKYLSGEEVPVVSQSLDVNGDGDVNNKDMTRLMKYLSGEDIVIF